MSNRPRRAATTKPKTVKAALARKTTRTTHFDIPLEPSEKVDEIRHRLEMARQRLFVIEPHLFKTAEDYEKVHQAAEDLVAKTKAELDECFWRLEFRGLPGDDTLDALMNQYPPTEEQVAKAQAEIDQAKADGKNENDPDFPQLPAVDLDAFNVAYLMATLVNPDPDMTAEDWRAELWGPNWTPADRFDLWSKIAATRLPFSAAVPFE